MHHNMLEQHELERWLEAVDEQFQDGHGVGIYDVPDYDWTGCFEDGATPEEAIETWEEEEMT